MIDAELSAEDRRVILVDGFNVLHAVLLKEDRESGWWRRALRERLLRRVSDWPGGDDEIWVAFDGAQPSWSVWAEPVATILPARRSGAKGPDARGGPTVHNLYVESADDWIVRRARRTPHPDRTFVVTADRRVAGRARSAGCEIWTPWAFMARCPSGGSDHAPLPGLAADPPRAHEPKH
ncbi:MAG: NYN domain-containing protein [bacterium]|nr:hypothetical protein [Deltaproteobacteria bacterium]MCP4908442.1 NYN domain-containing protein [bacterium]